MNPEKLNISKRNLLFLLLMAIISNIYCQYNPPPQDFSTLPPQSFYNNVVQSTQ